MYEALIDHVLEAKAAAEAMFVNQIAMGTPLDQRQTAAILIAQVQAIIDAEKVPEIPQPSSETAPEPIAAEPEGVPAQVETGEADPMNPNEEAS